MKYANFSINDWCADRDDNNLSLEQEALLFRMYLLGCRRQAHLLDDDVQTAKMLHVDVRSYRRLLPALVSSGLVERQNGDLIIQRVSVAIEASEDHRRKASEGGRKSAISRTSGQYPPEHPADVPPAVSKISGDKSPLGSSNVNDLAATTPKPSPKTIPKPKKREREEALSPSEGSDFRSGQSSADSANVVAFRKPESRDGWSLPEEWRAYALERGLTENEVCSEAITFRVKASELTLGNWEVWVERAIKWPGRKTPFVLPELRTSASSSPANPYPSDDPLYQYFIRPVDEGYWAVWMNSFLDGGRQDWADEAAQRGGLYVQALSPRSSPKFRMADRSKAASTAEVA